MKQNLEINIINEIMDTMIINQAPACACTYLSSDGVSCIMVANSLTVNL